MTYMYIYIYNNHIYIYIYTYYMYYMSVCGVRQILIMISTYS